MSEKVVVLDMQPIEPAIGGGRIRLLGLYSGFNNGLEVTYVGSYDWPGPKERELQLSECLKEVDIPLSPKHFEENEKLNIKIPGKTIIDVTFNMLAEYSPELIKRAKREVRDANIVIFSHPWLFKSIAPSIDSEKQLVVYDSQNCEGLLRTKLLDDGDGFGNYLARNVVKAEYEICHAADLVLACSEEDRQSFSKLYGVNPDKVIIAANGVFSNKITPVSEAQKIDAKKKLGLHGTTAIFVGSNYIPNVEAARLICDTAIKMPDVTFIIMGGVGEGIKNAAIADMQNVVVTGFVNEDEKLLYLAASDIALNPMMSGSGTNIKMFDYMAAGIPVITTEIGARGIPNLYENYYLCDESSLDKAIMKILGSSKLRDRIGVNGRKLVCEKFSWENISVELGVNLKHKYKTKVSGKTPFFSVVIPSYERPDLLSNLLDRLANQKEKDFEVIIVDQSAKPFTKISNYREMNILYLHTSIKGAVKARNTGIKFACGQVVAFIDDDCEPDSFWLYNAKKYFGDPRVAGVEGMITSTKLNDPNYRTVSNVGFEGIGFMTANLFVKRVILNEINGFDECFDSPHFREDTDLGWRVQAYGEIPYAKDVSVYHPPHRREVERESAEERAKFFVHDPLLLSKHPDKYVELFIKENHYVNTELFWAYFIKGIERHGIPKQLDYIINDRRIDKKHIPAEIISLSH